MHLVNALLYGRLAAVAALLYRRLIGPGAVAGFPALLFAIDDGHAYAVSWISSRNTLLAALFALLLHLRWREPGAAFARRVRCARRSRCSAPRSRSRRRA